ncbi:MAG: serine/threonine protein kinase [Acidobacteria bacterium]|nr:serine/threonine protein kinase [Acidobacteriota bacterium]
MHPKRFGKFRILKKLPGGGMGRVYHAIDTESEAPVALKLIDHGPDPESIEIVEAERRGAILQSRLCAVDPRVTLICEYGDLDGFFYIAMEYIEGRDLAELLGGAGIGLPFAVRITRDVCDVLDHTHNFRTTIDGLEFQGIVHGDIKPRNIRITPHGEVKLLDFGIAKALSLTRKFTANQFGSVQYSSPERLNTGEVDRRSDLWSVGVVLYEMAARRPYFHAENVPKLDHFIRNYSALRPMPETFPEGVKAVLGRALAPDPGARYATAAEFRDALEEILPAVPPTLPGVDDVEATRRTSAAGSGAGEPATARSAAAVAVADEETRRTTAAPRPAKAAPAPRKPKHAPNSRARAVRLAIAGFMTVFLGYLFVNEIDVWREGAQLARELEAEKLRDLNSAWTRYQELSLSAHLGPTLSAPRQALRRRLLAQADQVIGEYRHSDSPTVGKADWLRAQASAAHALELLPGDDQIRGKLRLAEAHLDRIQGTAVRESRLLNAAREKFEQAARLMPKSPDPYLGLARLEVYSFHDIDRAEDALREAQRRGHDPGRRETAQLADGYRDRAERMMREAENSLDMPEEQDYLRRAEKDYQRARELYESIVPFAGSANSLRRVHDGLALIERRREELRQVQ